jgi:hypothetical protein
MRPLTKRQAWAKIAEAFAKKDGSARRRGDGLTSSGLCWAVRIVTGGAFGDNPDVYSDMLADLRAIRNDANKDPMLPGWWWPCYYERDFTAAADRERAMLAQLLAEAAE